MRRRLFLAGVATAMAARPAAAGCLAFCDDEVPAGEARSRFEATLGQPLPEGVDVLGMIDGGFQDRFIQVKLRATQGAAPELYALLGASEGAFAPVAGQQLVIAEAEWWDVLARDPQVAEGRLASFASVHVARSLEQDADAVLIYVIAFQT